MYAFITNDKNGTVPLRLSTMTQWHTGNHATEDMKIFPTFKITYIYLLFYCKWVLARWQ
jgi:hypothetical protein